jgi:pimeloyl-ACP methyl ester carboxylesterase
MDWWADVTSVSFRTEAIGGTLRPATDEDVFRLARAQTLVLLVHGYNNPQAKAEEAYRGFRCVQGMLGDLNDARPVGYGSMVEVYWPGDFNLGRASALLYMLCVPRARNSAERVATALQRAAALGGPKTVDIVAHSLGCRLTLELIERLTGTPDVQLRRVVLMAAAVPTYMLEVGGRLSALFRTRHVERLQSLYSGSDMALAAAFPVGQTLAGEGISPTALGHALWPASLASFAIFEQVEVSGAGHSQYWGWQELDPGERSASGPWWRANKEVRDFFGFGPGSRDVPSRIVAERETGWR